MKKKNASRSNNQFIQGGGVRLVSPDPRLAPIRSSIKNGPTSPDWFCRKARTGDRLHQSRHLYNVYTGLYQGEQPPSWLHGPRSIRRTSQDLNQPLWGLPSAWRARNPGRSCRPGGQNTRSHSSWARSHGRTPPSGRFQGRRLMGPRTFRSIDSNHKLEAWAQSGRADSGVREGPVE